VADGLRPPQLTGLVTPQGSSQRRSYLLTGPHEKWFKLPCRSIVKDGVIRPFTTFTLRPKHELHALRRYLYLAAVPSTPTRTRWPPTRPSTTHRHPGARHPARVALLISSGLLIDIDRE
jgi:hypothetical protein